MRNVPYELTRCPVCAGTDTIQIADNAAIREEIERVWVFHTHRLQAPVPPSYLMDRVVFSQDPPLQLVQCGTCAHVYRNPRERTDALRDVYGESASDERVYRSLLTTQREAYQAQMRRLMRVAGATGRGLEVGSYVGGFLSAARDRGWSFTGVDVNASASAFAVRQGFAVVTGTIEDVVERQPYDVVAIWNTFEQLPDARNAARAAWRLLRPDGVLAVRVPNGDFYVHWRRRLQGVWAGVAERVLAHNNLLGFPYRQGFVASSMAQVLDEAGFDIISTYGDTLVPIADRWTTRLGRLDERVTKGVQRVLHRGWRAPWVEVYARARASNAWTSSSVVSEKSSYQSPTA